MNVHVHPIENSRNCKLSALQNSNQAAAKTAAGVDQASRPAAERAHAAGGQAWDDLTLDGRAMGAMRAAKSRRKKPPRCPGAAISARSGWRRRAARPCTSTCRCWPNRRMYTATPSAARRALAGCRTSCARRCGMILTELGPAHGIPNAHAQVGPGADSIEARPGWPEPGHLQRHAGRG